MKLPSVSILIPTLNSEKVLEGCLKSISEQSYPKDKVQIIVADGGSIDKTLEIARKYHAQVCENLLKTGEAGKAVALQKARGELIALIDSDNILPNKNWLKKMVLPFEDGEILGSEPWEFTYRLQDSYLSRYCALLGANDPYCFFVGNYDKKSLLSGHWTGIELSEEDKGSYLKVIFKDNKLPTIGANGTIWRKEVLKKVVVGNYLFDTDIPYQIKKPFCFAKVKIGIIHLYCQYFSDFYRKQKRRARDFFYLEKTNSRSQTYQRQMSKQILFILSVTTIIPLIFQSVKGYLKKRDAAWFFHPIASFTTLWIYGTETIMSFFKTQEMSRKGWKQ
jgi:glycosyltransferase involved in cell wall biosynthesis